MKELVCPNCNHVFQVDDAVFESIASQVRTSVFNEEVTRRVEEIRGQLKSSSEVEALKIQQGYDAQVSAKEKALIEKDAEIAELRGKLAAADDKRSLEVAAAVQAKEETITQLSRKLEVMKSNAESERKLVEANAEVALQSKLHDKEKEISAVREEFGRKVSDLELKLAEQQRKTTEALTEKDKEIQLIKNFRTSLSTKMIGESLEVSCKQEFDAAQSLGLFPDATFDKDNDARLGSKGDFIFRDYINGEEYISIMFEMKNESDETAAKHRNSDFFDKLHKDRQNKECEYAVLVSMLERDNEIYNRGIFNASHIYPKMFVIRPGILMPFLSMLCYAARQNIMKIQALQSDLAIAREQTVDVSRFEQKRDAFAQAFKKLVDDHEKKQSEALEGIDKVIASLEKQIEQLRKTKNLFETSGKKLLKANERVESDFTIKKLTHGNKTMQKKFAEARQIEQAAGSAIEDLSGTEDV